MTLTANARLIDDKMKFDCTAGDGHKIISDYTPPYGSGEGPTSLEIFLASLCSCLGVHACRDTAPVGQKLFRYRSYSRRKP